MKQFKNEIYLLIVCVVAALSFLSVGCASMVGPDGNLKPITDDAVARTTAYFAGRSMAAIVLTQDENPNLKAADPELKWLWQANFQTFKPGDTVQPSTVMQFFNGSIAILARHAGDKYGIASDLSYLLSLYGAQFDNEGAMIQVEPVPYNVIYDFGRGWDNTRMMIEILSKEDND